MDAPPIILFGEVVDTKDPDKLGRVKVRLDGLEKELTLPWLRVVLPYATNAAGFGFLPEKGDMVAVLRGAGNHPDAMLVLGAVHDGKRGPAVPDPDGKNDLKQIKTRSGHRVALLDKKGEESIIIESGDQKLSLTLDQKAGTLTVKADKELVLISESKVTVKAKEVNVAASDKITLKGDSKVTLEGSSAVEVKSSASIKLTGGMVQISGTAVEIG